MNSDLRKIARPILYEASEYDGLTNFEMTYGGTGSSFFVSLQGNHFLVTANHVVDKLGGPPESLRIYPTDESRISVPFDELVTIRLNNTGDESYKDLYLLRVSNERFTASTDAQIVSYDLDSGCVDPQRILRGEKMQVIGFPSEGRKVDYEQFKISYVQHLLEAEFIGASIMSHCYSVRLTENGGLNSLDGFSGSPVFYVKSPECLRLAGILTNGTASSGICHFIGVHVLVSAIKKAVGKPLAT